MYASYTDSMVAQHRTALAADAKRTRLSREARVARTSADRLKPAQETRRTRALRFPRFVLPRIAVAR